MASEVDAGGTLTLKGTPLAELRVTDLKLELEHRGLSKSGSKIQLIERLKAQLLLEKLQQEAALSSGDEHEGKKVPNIALQQDDKAGQSEFVRQYLQQQQRNLEIQMGVKKQFEEERKMRSADESSADDESRPTDVPDDPELTSSKQFKDDTSNAPAKEASKMPRSVRKSNRNSLKGDSGSMPDEGKNRSESPRLDKARQRKRSASSLSSRSPSPDQSSHSRRGRATRSAARKVERSRSSSSSSPEASLKKNERHRNSSSRSGSRSPRAVSPKMHAQRSHRRLDVGQAAEKDKPCGGSGDKSVGKNENADTIVASSSRKKWRKKQPSAPALAESTNSNQRKESVTTSAALSTTDDTKERQNPDGESSKDKVTEEEDVREVVTVLPTTVPNIAAAKSGALAAAKSGALAGNTKEPASEKGRLISEENCQKHEQDERIVEETASAKGPNNLSRRQRSRSSSSDSSSVGSRSRSRSPSGKKGKGSRSHSSSNSDSETRSSGSSSDSSRDGSPKKASKANGKAETPARKVSLTQERGDVAEEMEVENSNNKSPARKTGHNERGCKDSTVPSSTSGEPKSKGQEEKQNNLDKEQDNRSAESEQQHGVTPCGPDDSGSRVAESLEKAKDADEETAAKKGVKKRKWNSKASKAAKTTKRTSSLEISSDVLKNLIGDVKLSETVFEMETEVVNMLDYDDQDEDQRDVKVKKAPSPNEDEKPEEEDARRVETRDASPEPAEVSSEPDKKIIKLSSAAPKIGMKTKVKEGKKSKDDKKGDAAEKKEKKLEAVADTEAKAEKVVSTNRVIKPMMSMVDEPEPVSGQLSPPRNPPDRAIHINGLVRPFTVNQLKELLRRSGELDDDYFWISDIKSHCMAAFKTKEQAAAARAALHGTRWPQSNPKILWVDFATVDDVMFRKEGKDLLPSPRKRPQEEQKKIKEPKSVEKEEKKHKAKDPKERNRVEREKEERDVKDRKRDTEKKNFVREWDRDKIQQLSRSRSKSKDRDRLARRSRSREREQRKRGEYNKDKREEDRRKEKKQKEAKAEEEPPAKLLDDLFRKTKATPCIYWLPLTEEQAQQRLAEKQKQIAAIEERKKEQEKEDVKKREAARLERQRERDKAREKDRDKAGEKDRERAGEKDRERDKDRERAGEKDRERDKDRERAGEKDRERDKDRERTGEKDRGRDRSKQDRKTSRSSSRSRSRRRR